MQKNKGYLLQNPGNKLNVYQYSPAAYSWNGKISNHYKEYKIKDTDLEQSSTNYYAKSQKNKLQINVFF